jgi:hypothetical protein
MEQSQAIATTNNSMESIGSNNNVKSFCSVHVETMEEKKVLFNALETCDILLNDIVGQTITMKDVYIEERAKVDEETGEVKNKFRTIIFDDEGKTYVTGAYGIFNVLKKLMTVYGAPTWEEGLTVKVIKKSIGDGKTSLSLVVA